MNIVAIIAVLGVASCADPQPKVSCVGCFDDPPGCVGPECMEVPGGGCARGSSQGPIGTLVDYEIASNGSAWMLTREPDSELTMLWEQRSGAWHQVLFDVSCRRGFLALNPQGRPYVTNCRGLKSPG